MAVPEKVLAGELMGAHRPLGEGEAGDIEVHREFLVLSRELGSPRCRRFDYRCC